MRYAPFAALLLACSGASATSPDATLPTVDAASPADATVDAASGSDAAPETIVEAGLPLIHDFSGASRGHVLALVRAALDGLGFDPAQGPSPDDRVFVGRHYLAWIDQTGFYGKMNGLWTLNGAGGDALDFVLKEPDGRPVNLFVPGEDGDGRWPMSYKGGEHVEFPSRVPEPNDDPACAQHDWCNQYGLNEAVPYTNPRIPWWSSCNAGAASFATKLEPVEISALPDGIKLVYEGHLVKEADGDGTYDGDACHQDYLFSDGVRRPVFLRVGYELHADQDYFERTMQIRNPAGNPSFSGDMSLIGGFVMSEWPGAHYLKRLNRFWRPESADTTVAWGGESVVLHAGSFNDLSTRAPLTSDVLVAWIKQPLTLAPHAGYGAGQAVTLAHVGSIDNDDVGACLCSVHGGIEMGGGLVHAGISLPVAGGASTVEAHRRLTVPSAGTPPPVIAHVFEAETSSALGHQRGRIDGDGWSCNTAGDSAGHMSYGPYAVDWGAGSAQAAFWLMVDNNNADNGKVVTLDVYDADTDQVLATRELYRKEWRAPGVYQRFGLDFGLDGRAGHRIETRVYWHDISYVKLDKIIVNTAP
jgi:hypothetical protein